MNPLTPTVGASPSPRKALWGMISGAAIGAGGGALFAATQKRKGPKYDLMNYVTFGALVGAGVMGVWQLLR